MKKILALLTLIFVVGSVYFLFFYTGEGFLGIEKPVSETVAPNSVPTPAPTPVPVNEENEENKELYPFYNQLSDEEKVVYNKICTAAQNFDETATSIYIGKTEKEVDDYVDDLVDFYREVIYEQTDLFWVDPYSFNTTVWSEENKYTLDIKPVYLYTKDEAAKMTKTFDAKVDEIVENAETKKTTYDEILYVHDYIVENCVYDDAAAANDNYKGSSITAYGCLIDGKAICSGYTMAFTTIMRELGYECGPEFNNYSDIKFTLKERHVWNYCNIDGEYYYFDLTWDDTSPTEEIYKYMPYNHSYFGLTANELKLTKQHIVDPTGAITPPCNGTKYNYFNYNELSFKTYDYDTVKAAVEDLGDNAYIELRFEKASEATAAQTDLITNSKIFEIFPEYTSVEYFESETKLQLYILLTEKAQT